MLAVAVVPLLRRIEMLRMKIRLMSLAAALPSLVLAAGMGKTW
jgi:hypothetical protein